MSGLSDGQAEEIARSAIDATGRIRVDKLRPALGSLRTLADIGLNVQARIPNELDAEWRSGTVSGLLREVQDALHSLLEAALRSPLERPNLPLSYSLVLADTARRYEDEPALASMLRPVEWAMGSILELPDTVSESVLSAYLTDLERTAANERLRLDTTEMFAEVDSRFASLNWETWLRHLLILQKEVIDAATRDADRLWLEEAHRRIGSTAALIASTHSRRVVLPDGLYDRSLSSHPQTEATRVALVGIAWNLFQSLGSPSSVLAEIRGQAFDHLMPELVYPAWIQEASIVPGFGGRGWSYWESAEPSGEAARFLSMPSLVDASMALAFARSEQARSFVLTSIADVWQTGRGSALVYSLERSSAVLSDHLDDLDVTVDDLQAIESFREEVSTSLARIRRVHISQAQLSEETFSGFTEALDQRTRTEGYFESLIRLESTQATPEEAYLGLRSHRPRSDFLDSGDPEYSGAPKETARAIAESMFQGEINELCGELSRMVSDSRELAEVTERVVQSAEAGHPTIVFGSYELFANIRTLSREQGLHSPADDRLTVGVGNSIVTLVNPDSRHLTQSFAATLLSPEAITLRYGTPNANEDSPWESVLGGRFRVELAGIEESLTDRNADPFVTISFSQWIEILVDPSNTAVVGVEDEWD